MANKLPARREVHPAAVAAVIAVVVMLVVAIGWHSLASNSDSARVPVDINQVKEHIKKYGYAHH